MTHRLLVMGNGTSVHTQKWIEGLGQTGEWEIYLITMNPAPPLDAIGGIQALKDVIQIAPPKVNEGGGNVQYLYKLPALRRKVRAINPHAITTLYLSSYGFMAALVKGSAKLLHCTIGNDVMLFPDKGRLQDYITRFALRRSDFVVSVSGTMAQKLTGRFGYPPSRLLTQQYGVGDWLMENPRPAPEYDLISNRQWIANSNIEYVMEILGRLPKAKALVIGSVLAGNEALGARIESVIPQNCKVISWVPYEENIRLVSSSRFLISLTSSDGASLSVMEAMALGTIPILSDIAPNREWVTHGENGFLIPQNDVAEAVRRFEQALNMSEDQQQQFRMKNREIIFERGLLSRNMARVSRKLKELISPSPQPYESSPAQ